MGRAAAGWRIAGLWLFATTLLALTTTDPAKAGAEPGRLP
jgi:hypothetical protein